MSDLTNVMTFKMKTVTVAHQNSNNVVKCFSKRQETEILGSLNG